MRFRSDGAPSRDDTCGHDYRRFEKCPHCLEAENERLREALRGVIRVADRDTAEFAAARAALGEGKDD